MNSKTNAYYQHVDLHNRIRKVLNDKFHELHSDWIIFNESGHIGEHFRQLIDLYEDLGFDGHHARDMTVNIITTEAMYKHIQLPSIPFLNNTGPSTLKDLLERVLLILVVDQDDLPELLTSARADLEAATDELRKVLEIEDLESFKVDRLEQIYRDPTPTNTDRG